MVIFFDFFFLIRLTRLSFLQWLPTIMGILWASPVLLDSSVSTAWQVLALHMIMLENISLLIHQKLQHDSRAIVQNCAESLFFKKRLYTITPIHQWFHVTEEHQLYNYLFRLKYYPADESHPSFLGHRGLYLYFWQPICSLISPQWQINFLLLWLQILSWISFHIS